MLNVLQYTFSAKVRRALKGYDVVVAATTGYKRKIDRIVGKSHHSKIYYRPENCINRLFDLNVDKFSSPTLRLVYCGELSRGKNLRSVIDALALIPADAPLTLDVLGEGALKASLKAYATKRGVEHFVRWRGKVPREEVFAIMNNAHLHVLPSIYDANTTVIWEAMAMGLPTLALKTCGFRDTVNNDTGFSIDKKNYRQVVRDIANCLKDIIARPAVLKEKAERLLQERQQYTWEQRERFFEEMYETAEQNHKARPYK